MHVPPPNVRHIVGMRLGHTARQWRLALDERLQPFGLTDATWLPLLHVARAGAPMRQKDLADALGIDGSTLVRLIDSLDRAGLIERHPNADRRARTLHLTQRGRALFEQVEEATIAVRQEILNGISDEDLAVTVGVTERICAALAKIRTAEPANAS